MISPNVRPENPGSTLSTIRDWEPLRQLREMLRFDPFTSPLGEVLRSELRGTFQPDFDVKETKDAYVIRADVPGVKEENLELSLSGNRLVINGKRETEKEEKGETYYHVERQYGAFLRSFTLPEGIKAEDVHADLKDGVLTVHVPKMKEAATKKIPIKAPERAKA